MTNPDLPSAVDLTLHRVSERDLVDAAVAAVLVRVPEWEPQEADMEVMLTEGFAIIAGQAVFAINQLPGVVLDGLLALNNVQRLQAVQAVADVEITLASTTLTTKALPKGARFRVPLEGGRSVDVETNAAVQINPSDGITAIINTTAVDAGASANDVPAGTPVQAVDVINWIESAKLATNLTGGADAEPDEVFHARAAASLRRRSDTLVVAEHFQTAALDIPGVGRAKALDLWDGTGTVGTDPGHVTVAAATPTGGAASSPVKSAVLARLTAGAVAGLSIHVVDPDFQPFGLTVTLEAATGAVPGDVDNAVTAYLLEWLSPATWAWGDRLYANDVITRVGNLPGVRRVLTVTGPAVDLTAPGPLMLPLTPVTVSVTVT